MHSLGTASGAGDMRSVKGCLKTTAVTCCVLALLVAVSTRGQANDGPPVVTITAPRNQSRSHWNALVNYSIVGTYQGKSTEYQEIPAKDVLLKTTYVPDVSAIAVKPDAAPSRTPAGLLAITHATCLGCHSLKAKGMGPSFAAVAQRYPESQVAMNVLSQHIRKGAGLWGQ